MIYYPIQLFHFAAHGYQYFTEIEQLLAQSPHFVDTKNAFEDTPAMIAAKMKHFDIMFYLIEKGADINVKNKQGLTVFSYVAKASMDATSKKNILFQLLEQGAQFNEYEFSQDKDISGEILQYLKDYRIKKHKENLDNILSKKHSHSTLLKI